MIVLKCTVFAMLLKKVNILFKSFLVNSLRLQMNVLWATNNISFYVWNLKWFGAFKAILGIYSSCINQLCVSKWIWLRSI